MGQDATDSATSEIPLKGFSRSKRSIALRMPGLSDFLCVEPYTAREGEEIVWRRTTPRSFPKSCWISC